MSAVDVDADHTPEFPVTDDLPDLVVSKADGETLVQERGEAAAWLSAKTTVDAER